MNKKNTKQENHNPHRKEKFQETAINTPHYPQSHQVMITNATGAQTWPGYHQQYVNQQFSQLPQSPMNVLPFAREGDINTRGQSCLSHNNFPDKIIMQEKQISGCQGNSLKIHRQYIHSLGESEGSLSPSRRVGGKIREQQVDTTHSQEGLCHRPIRPPRVSENSKNIRKKLVDRQNDHVRGVRRHMNQERIMRRNRMLTDDQITNIIFEVTVLKVNSHEVAQKYHISTQTIRDLVQMHREETAQDGDGNHNGNGKEKQSVQSDEYGALLQTEGSTLCKLAPVTKRCRLNLLVTPHNPDDPIGEGASGQTQDYFTLPLAVLQRACQDGEHHEMSLRTRLEMGSQDQPQVKIPKKENYEVEKAIFSREVTDSELKAIKDMHRAIQADKRQARESLKEAVNTEGNAATALSDLTRNHSETVNKNQEEAKIHLLRPKSQRSAGQLMIKQAPTQDFEQPFQYTNQNRYPVNHPQGYQNTPQQHLPRISLLGGQQFGQQQQPVVYYQQSNPSFQQSERPYPLQNQ